MVESTVETYVNIEPAKLIEMAVARGEGVLSANGALVVETGRRTGRSPNDKFIVKDTVTENTVDWGAVNRPIAADLFNRLWQRAWDELGKAPYFESHLQVGADAKHGLPVHVVTQTAWHHVFANNLFIRPEQPDLASLPDQAWQLVSVPGLQTDPARDGVNSDATVMIDFSAKRVLLCGLRYAGESKKAMFTVLNYLLPAQDVLPMHCAANQGEAGDVALFFGLSGTGKTTLSADPERFLIGDDEHGWGPDGVFNFEGGCYAKCIHLSAEHEPVIWQAIRHGAIMENVVLDAQTQVPNFDDTRLTQNTRAAYPLSHIEKRVPESQGGHPSAVLFLTCDLQGVLPPVAKLTKEQAAYYFLSGYTAKVGSTEVGSSAEIESTFSACFGAPFFPRSPRVYAELLMKRIAETGAGVYLVNTGWTGGACGRGGERFSIVSTRAIVRAILTGALAEADYHVLPRLGLAVPRQVAGVADQVLDPKQCWADNAAYDEAVAQLVAQFQANFATFAVDEAIVQAGPQ